MAGTSADERRREPAGDAWRLDRWGHNPKGFMRSDHSWPPLVADRFEPPTRWSKWQEWARRPTFAGTAAHTTANEELNAVRPMGSVIMTETSDGVAPDTGTRNSVGSVASRMPGASASEIASVTGPLVSKIVNRNGPSEFVGAAAVKVTSNAPPTIVAEVGTGARGGNGSRLTTRATADGADLVSRPGTEQRATTR